MFTEEKDEVVQLYLDDIIPNRFQPREVFDEKALKELAVSIKEHGVIQPIIVRKADNGKYEIIAGERRYKASALAGMTRIPAIVRNLDDKESSKVALLENLQRKNLNPIEEARTYQKILEIDQMTQDELAKTMGKTQSAVANKIRLLSLPDEVQNALLKEQISERHARTLLSVDDKDKQKDLLKKVIDTKMSVRALEDEIKSSGTKIEEINEEITNYISSEPLTPTVISEKTAENTNTVRIVPPKGEENMGRFVNYEDDSDAGFFGVPGMETAPKTKPQEDIRTNSKSSADLDNLLNINGITGYTSKEFITPAEKIVKADPFKETNNSGDYFKTNDLSSLGLPSGFGGSTLVPTSNVDAGPSIPKIAPTNNIESAPSSMGLKPVSNISTAKPTLEEAKGRIRGLIEELKSLGVPIMVDEMNFEKTYQMIVKLDKTQI